MAAAKKAGAASAKSKKAAQVKDDAPKIVKADPNHPDLHPDRHAASGLQELPTAGGTTNADNPDGHLPAGGSAGAKQAEVDPQPSLGVTRSPADTKGPATATVDEDADYVWSYEQALSLPVVESGSAVKAPSDAQKKKWEKEHKDAGNNVRGLPVLAFKDKDRRTMIVVRSGGKLAAMPQKGQPTLI